MISLVEFGLVSVVLFFGISYLYFNDKNRKNLPPGPRGLPLVGSLLSLGSQPHLAFSSWVKHYGNVMCVKLFGLKVIVISDAKLAKEAFNNPLLNGKPDMDLFKLFSGGDYGVISTVGDEWVEQRRFTLRHLRDHGFAKSVSSEYIMDEVDEFIEWMKTKAEAQEPISMNRKFSLAVVNSLWRIMAGKRYRHDDPQLNHILDTGNDAIEKLNRNPIGIFFPGIAAMFSKLTGWDQVVNSVEASRKIFASTIAEHQSQFSGEPDEVPKDFIDSYIQEVKKTTNKDSTFYKELGEKNLLASVTDLFGAGNATTSLTLAWNILYLTLFPEVQEKLQKEIDTVVGNQRRVTLADRKDLPYAESIILETLRKSSFTPMGLFHAAMEDTTLASYHIPKNSWIAINQYHVHHDPKVWGDPFNFRPERFLSEDGKSVVKNENITSFSVGKRACIGENLAKDTLFLFITNMFQQFNISIAPNSPKPSIESKNSLFLDPDYFEVVFKDRIAV